MWQPPHGIRYNPKSKQFITSLLFSASLTYLYLDLLRLSFSLPSSLLWSSTHSSVLFAHLSSSHSARSHYTLNIHICGSISMFFPEFPYQQLLAFLCQTRLKNFTSMHTFPSHLQAFISYTLVCTIPYYTSQPLLPPILQEQLSVSSHTPIFPALLPHLVAPL